MRTSAYVAPPFFAASSARETTSSRVRSETAGPCARGPATRSPPHALVRAAMAEPPRKVLRESDMGAQPTRKKLTAHSSQLTGREGHRFMDELWGCIVLAMLSRRFLGLAFLTAATLTA